jgi:WD40 repeat protein
MGACFSQEGRRLHERLDEYDDDYFSKAESCDSVEEKNDDDYFSKAESCDSVEEKNSRCLGENISSIGNQPDVRLENEKFEQSRRNFPECDWTIPSSESEPSPTTSAFEDISFSLSSPSSLQNASMKFLSEPNAFTNKPGVPHQQGTFGAGHAGGWHDKQKGRALQLRLAKHHILQMAVTSQPSPYGNSVTPMTIDSSFFTEVDTTSQPEDDARDLSVSWPTIVPASLPSQSRSKGENISFNRSHGLIWKEIVCDDNVTAVAMNRINLDSSSLESTSRSIDPLMLAMGDEKGNIVITQIIDESLQSIDDKDGEDSLLECNMKLGSDALEFSIEGKVRSLDFGTHEHLVVGGDGCYAWILQVIIDISSQAPQDIVVVHKLERIDRIYAVRFSHDQKFLAVGGFDGKVALVPMSTVWNKEELERDYNSDDEDYFGQLMKDSVIELKRPGLIYCLDWSPEGDYLAIAGSDKICGIYNASNFDSIHETKSRSAAIQDLQWSNDGKYLAMGDREVTIIKGKPPFKIKKEISHKPKSSAMAQFRYRITSLCWSPSDTYLAIGGSDGRCLLVETKGWALVYEHNGMQSINALSWGQQMSDSTGDIRRYLVVSDNECNVALIKAGVESQGSEHADDISSVASSSYHSQSTMSSDWVLREDEFRDLDDVKEKLTRGLKSQATITTIAFSKTKKTSSYLAYAADDCSLTIMCTRDWKAVFVSVSTAIWSGLFSLVNL